LAPTQIDQKAEEKKVYPGSSHEAQNPIIVSWPATLATVSHHFKPGPASVERTDRCHTQIGVWSFL